MKTYEETTAAAVLPERVHSAQLRPFLDDLRKRDIRVWLDGHRLRVNAPAGTLTPDLQRDIAYRKSDIVALLRLADTAAGSSNEPSSLSGGHPGPAEGVRAGSGNGQLSFAQERLWFLDQLEGPRAAYNVPLAIRLHGPLDLQALQDSLDALLARHSALRTTFHMRAAGLVQTINEPRAVDLSCVDLRGELAAVREASLAQVLAQESRRPFKLSEGPLLRATVVRLDDFDHALLITLHHIACDGWSLGVLKRDVSELYEACRTGRTPSLPVLPIQYADYATWQRQRIAGPELERLVEYWRGQIHGAPLLLELPTDRPTPRVSSGRGDSVALDVPGHLVGALGEVSRAHRATLFMTLLAGFGALLSRYSGQQDVLVGTPIAGRTTTDLEDLIGLFVNTLALRVDASPELTFGQLLDQVRETALDAYAHQELPFEKLVELVQPDRSLAHHPVIQAQFALQNTRQPTIRPGHVSGNVMEVQTGTTKVDLNLTFWENGTALEGWLEYDADLFDRATIERIAAHYRSLLEFVVAQPNRTIADLLVLAQGDREQVVEEWNRTDADYPREAGVHHLVEQQAALVPDAVAIVFEQTSITYAELNGRANQLARHLQELGVGRETVVGVHLERSIDLVVALLGILKAGGAYLPLDPLFPAERLAYMLADSHAAVVITQQRMLGTLVTGGATIVRLDSDWSAIAEQFPTDLQRLSFADRLAYVLYTSGSTGRPKGVQVLHSSVVNLLTAMRERPGLSSEDVLLSVTTLSFDIAALEIFLPLTTGARVVLVSSAVAADGPALLDAMRSSGATVMQATPATWRLLVSAGWQRLPHLRVLCGGEALSSDLAAQLVARAGSVWNLYGPTETTIWSTIHPVAASAEGSVSIGRPIANTRVYVLDARLQPLPIGVSGELYIGGHGVARGYLNQPELTAQRFVADPFSLDATARLYRTGDLVRWRADGTLEYLRRVDTQVKLRGFRIELGEIEALLEQDATVRQAVVVVREDVSGDKRLVGYVVPATSQGVSETALRERLKARLPAYMLPAVLVVVDRIPLTPNGKVDRNALATAPMTATLVVTDGYAGPRDDVERALAALWQELLGHDRFGIHDNFFDVGGHSLLAARLVFHIEATLDRNMPVATLIGSATIAQLASLIRAPEQDDIWDPLVQLQPGQPGHTPLFFVHGAFGDVLCYTELADALGSQQPCYVLQALGLDGVHAPQERVEDMAATYIHHMRSVQPVGPYCLAGYSIGGTIVFEMARQLKQAGEQVALLSVLDHPPALGSSSSQPAFGMFLLRFARNVVTNVPHWVRMARRVERGHWSATLHERAALARRALLGLLSRSAPSVEDVLRQVEETNGLTHLVDWPEYRRRVLEYQFRAMRLYELRPYAGQLLLFRARRQPLVSSHDPVLGWGEVIRGRIDVVHIAGNHKDLLHGPNVHVVAAALRARLDALVADAS